MYKSKEGKWEFSGEEISAIHNGDLEDPRSVFKACGTGTGYTYHFKFDEEMCFPCREAERLRSSRRRKEKGLPRKTFQNEICGTLSRYCYCGCRCDKCVEAHRKYSREHSWKVGKHIPRAEFLKGVESAYTDWFNATFLGTLSKNIEKRFKNWVKDKRYGFTRLEINEYRQQHWNCWYCKEHLLNKVIHVDHRLPVSRGGRNEIENLVLTCAECNFSKNDMTDDEFIERKYYDLSEFQRNYENDSSSSLRSCKPGSGNSRRSC